MFLLIGLYVIYFLEPTMVKKNEKETKLSFENCDSDINGQIKNSVLNQAT